MRFTDVPKVNDLINTFLLLHIMHIEFVGKNLLGGKLIKGNHNLKLIKTAAPNPSMQAIMLIHWKQWECREW